MDSNVSKNTHSHKLFKVSLAIERPHVSVKSALKKLLLSTLNLDRQKFALTLDHEFVAETLNRKIKLSTRNNQQFSSANKPGITLFTSKLMSIGYDCPLGLFLAASCQVSLPEVVDRLSALFRLNNLTDRSSLELHLEIAATGWLNFYLDSRSIATWLEQSLLSIQSDTVSTSTTELRSTPAKLFQVQYIHARCCSLLRLGARENLIVLKGDRQQTGWQIEQPSSISWLNTEHNLWLSEPAEYELLRQLLMVTDAQSECGDRPNWSKIALCLSRATAIFDAESRFLGEVKVRSSSKAIARLGLIALAQYWLEKILLEKLNLAAPKTL